MSEQDAIELYRKYRPTKLSEVLGQDGALSTLTAMGRSGKIPGFLLLTGPSGCGKTTIARILRRKLKVGKRDFIEINAAKDRGIDLLRSIERQCNFQPMEGPYKMWLVDEAHQLTPDAQGGFLKVLEDTKEWVRFVFCTTDPQKLKPTIKTRATIIELKSVPVDVLGKLVKETAQKEGKELNEDLTDKIAEYADGSPRKALVMLGQVLHIPESEQLDALTRSHPEKDAIEIARALLSGAGWKKVASIIKSIESIDDKAEGIRWLVLSFMASVAVNSPTKAGRACDVIEVFKHNFWDSKRAGLIQACYDACTCKE